MKFKKTMIIILACLCLFSCSSKNYSQSVYSDDYSEKVTLTFVQYEITDENPNLDDFIFNTFVTIYPYGYYLTENDIDQFKEIYGETLFFYSHVGSVSRHIFFEFHLIYEELIEENMLKPMIMTEKIVCFYAEYPNE